MYERLYIRGCVCCGNNYIARAYTIADILTFAALAYHPPRSPTLNPRRQSIVTYIQDTHCLCSTHHLIACRAVNGIVANKHRAVPSKAWLDFIEFSGRAPISFAEFTAWPSNIS